MAKPMTADATKAKTHMPSVLINLARRRSPLRRKTDMPDGSTECLLLAQSGHLSRHQQCPLLGVKRT
jgi:hypothetical protein